MFSVSGSMRSYGVCGCYIVADFDTVDGLGMVIVIGDGSSDGLYNIL